LFSVIKLFSKSQQVLILNTMGDNSNNKKEEGIDRRDFVRLSTAFFGLPFLGKGPFPEIWIGDGNSFRTPCL
jgi:hypothetical protein